MSLWRKEASIRLPELQKLVSSPRIDNPMMLWIELNMEFARVCADSPADADLLRRIWGYGLWCLDHRDDDVATAAAVAFFEHSIDSPSRIAQLSVTTTRPVIEGFKDLLAYHHTEEEIRTALACAFPNACLTQKR